MVRSGMPCLDIRKWTLTQAIKLALPNAMAPGSLRDIILFQGSFYCSCVFPIFFRCLWHYYLMLQCACLQSPGTRSSFLTQTFFQRLAIRQVIKASPSSLHDGNGLASSVRMRFLSRVHLKNCLASRMASHTYGWRGRGTAFSSACS